MNSHTKGPWMVGESSFAEPAGDIYIWTVDDTVEVASCTESDCDRNEARANALLIAAAPELLEIVSALHEWFEANGYNGNGPSGCSLVCSDDDTLGQHVRSAMAKVNGGVA